MKKLIIVISILLILTLSITPDVIKKSKSEVSFSKYGTFKTERTEIINLQMKRTDSVDEFKGKGFLNKLMAKILLRSGEFSNIIDLKKNEISNINHKKKTVNVTQIKKLISDEEESEAEEGEEKDAEKESSDVTITKNELTVSASGNKKMINNFPSAEYIVLWVIEWESNKDSKKGSGKLVSNVWTTPVTKIIASAQKIESGFFNDYMKKLGLDTEITRDEILGGAWMRIFSSLSRSSSWQGSENAEKFNKEIGKIQGYPVIIDGDYFASTSGEEKKKGFSSLLKKKKKEGEEEQPKFTFYTEILELSLIPSDPSKFNYPDEYKIK